MNQDEGKKQNKKIERKENGLFKSTWEGKVQKYGHHKNRNKRL